MESLEEAVKGALKKVLPKTAKNIIGIGIATIWSTPVPVDREGTIFSLNKDRGSHCHWGYTPEITACDADTFRRFKYACKSGKLFSAVVLGAAVFAAVSSGYYKDIY
jgi:ribulose kinase